VITAWKFWEFLEQFPTVRRKQVIALVDLPSRDAERVAVIV